MLAALADEMLAARADDVRSLGRRAARLAAGSVPAIADGSDFVLVADDLGPADIAELDTGVQAVALAARRRDRARRDRRALARDPAGRGAR